MGRDKGAGYLTIEDGKFDFSTAVNIGSDGGTGVMDVDAGTISAASCWLGRANTESDGTLTINGGAMTLSGNLEIGVKGKGSVAVGNGGSITAGTELFVGGSGASGSSDTGTGTLVIKGGTVTVNSYSSIGRAGRGTVILDGGSFVGKNDVDFGRWTGADGTLDVSNGTFTAQNRIFFGRDPGSGTINLCGGVLECNQIVVGASGKGITPTTLP